MDKLWSRILLISPITIHRKIMEREDELFIVGNILKSLEVSEEKVIIKSYLSFIDAYFVNNNIFDISQANQRVEEFKTQLKDLKVKLKTAEKRAIIAEKMVKMFSKELDAREGMFRFMIFSFFYIS